MLDLSHGQMLEFQAPALPYVGRATRIDPARTAADSRQAKLLRLELGGRPRILDLFAGCGGNVPGTGSIARVPKRASRPIFKSPAH